mmetsp:Transcript_10787/g.35752  ORF Transcript_10787/g.35752 Transcript_10787/m.35752 type:complete len:120 (+) Transcript_10787:3-362(+)
MSRLVISRERSVVELVDLCDPSPRVIMKLILLFFASASAFSFGGASKKASKTSSDGTVVTPDRWKPAFGDFGALAARQEARAMKIAAEKEALVPTPLKFQFAFGNPGALKARQAERLAK